MRRIGDDAHVEQERPLEELPHVVGRVDLLHLHFGVDVAVGEEVDVSILHFRNGISVHDHLDNVVQRQQRVTLDLSVDILPHGAARQEPHLQGRKLK